MTDADMKVCPYCAETIKLQALICRFCNRDLTDGSFVGPRATELASPGAASTGEVHARSGVADGVKLGCGMFIVLPLLLVGAAIVFVVCAGGLANHR